MLYLFERVKKHKHKHKFSEKNITMKRYKNEKVELGFIHY